MAEEATIGLAETIKALRAELAAAVREGAAQDLRFQVGPVELEFLLQVSRERGAQGGVKFWVISAEGKGGTSRAETHRVRLTLAPVTADGEDVMVTDHVITLPR